MPIVLVLCVLVLAGFWRFRERLLVTVSRSRNRLLFVKGDLRCGGTRVSSGIPGGIFQADFGEEQRTDRKEYGLTHLQCSCCFFSAA